MGTKVQCESYFPGYFSMMDLNEDSNSYSLPFYYGDKTFTNGQYYNGFLPRAIADAYLGYGMDEVKRTMLQHEAIFQKQLHELHRLYRIQRDLMDEIKRKELQKNRMPIETLFSSSSLASQITSDDARKWHIPSFPLASSTCARASTSGVGDIHSPVSSIKGSSMRANPLPCQNVVTSKDVEIQESRPTKVRRKMFDLQLPADEYIDTEEGEHSRDENLSVIPSYLPNRNHKIVSEDGINQFLDDGGKNKYKKDALQSESCLRSTNNVADLNEPVEVEEANASAYVDLRGRISSLGGIRGHELAGKPKSQHLGFPKEISPNSYDGINKGTLNNPHLQNHTDGNQWLTHMLESGHGKNNFKSLNQGLLPEKLPSSSQPMQVVFNKTHEPPNLFQTDQIKVDQLRDRTFCSLEFSGRNHGVSNNNHPEVVVSSHMPSPYTIVSSSDLGKSLSHSLSSWEKSSGSLSQKSISVQINPYLNSSATLSRSSQSSTQSNGVFGDRWNYSSTSASNPNFGSEMLHQNGFYHGSSSGFKESLVCVPSGNYDYLNCSGASVVPSEPFINHGSAKLCKSSHFPDLKPTKDANRAAPQQGLEVMDVKRKNEDHHAALPWLRAKPAIKNEATNGGLDLNKGELGFLQSSLKQLSNKNESGNGPHQMVIQNMKSASCSNVAEASKIEISDSSSCRKILGVPIFEKPHISKNDSSSFTSPSVPLPQPSEGEVENNRKNRILDINLPCDLAVPDVSQQTAAEVVLVEKETDTKVASFRCQIDLNSCMSEDETSLAPSIPGSKVNIIRGIDLEAPAVSETEEDVIPGKECTEKAQEEHLPLPQQKTESLQDESVRIAAEAIVAISSSGHHNQLNDATCSLSEASVTDPLHWFVEIVSACGEDLESKIDAVLGAKDGQDDDSSSEEIDYFESMTLQLTQTKEEDYMPKPLVPENLKLEETGTTLLPTRTRKGHARRGRQRRDFQRDILPGLASLSRHEVTEDLQTFGGLMRATGHLWHSGLMRRNSTRSGCARGRRRTHVSPSPAVTASPPWTPTPFPLVQQLSNIEVGLEDRSLTGWGKTRRPRRQRCPAGNPPPIPLT